MSSDRVAERRTPWAIRGIILAVLLILTGYGLAFGDEATARFGAVALAAGNALLAPAAMALGAPSHGRWARVIRIALWGTGLLLFSAVVVALAMPAAGPEAVLLLGFPRRVSIVLYGAGVLPLLILPALFAMSFDGSAFEPGRVDRVRALTPARTPGDKRSPPPGGE